MIEAEQAARFKTTMTGAAFVGWQLGRQLGGLKADLSFPKYLKIFGLDDKPPPLTPEQRKAIAKRSLETAAKIRAAHKAGKTTT